MTEKKYLLRYGLIYPLLLLVVMILSMRYGAVTSEWSDLLAVFTKDTSAKSDLILDFRLPRILAACVIGLYLALAGLIFQIILRNPLADPTILGVSSGASVAVVISMAFAMSLQQGIGIEKAASEYMPLAAVPPIALAGGLTAILIIIALSWQRGLVSQRLLLNGVMIAAVLNAILMAAVLGLSETRTEMAILWLAGSLYARDFDHILPALPWGMLAIAILVYFHRHLSILRFDSLTANSLGIAEKGMIFLFIWVAACLSASAVAIAGPIGFVGLLVPHITRYVTGPSILDQLLSAAFIGAILVTGSDLVGRVIAAPLEVPVGILTSLIGAPFFAILMRKRLSRSSHA